MKAKVLNYQIPYPMLDDSASREEMILRYAPLTKYIAHRLAMRLPSHISVKDLISAGVTGLIDAINKFNPQKNVDFKTYAEFRIRGAMLDELRALDWVPRSARQKATQIEKTILDLERKNGRPAEDEEIANQLDLTVEDFHNVMNEINGISLLDTEGLRHKVSHLPEEDILNSIPDERENDAFNLLSLKEMKGILTRAIEGLSQREKTVIALYYYEELTLKEIGETLNLTESRICQIHTKCLLKLRGKLRRSLQDGL